MGSFPNTHLVQDWVLAPLSYWLLYFTPARESTGGCGPERSGPRLSPTAALPKARRRHGFIVVVGWPSGVLRLRQPRSIIVRNRSAADLGGFGSARGSVIEANRADSGLESAAASSHRCGGWRHSYVSFCTAVWKIGRPVGCSSAFDRSAQDSG